MENFLKISLNRPPSVLYASVGIHGQKNVENYLLPQLWCLHLCRYHAVWVVADQLVPIEPGTAILIAPNTPMEFRFNSGRHVHISIHFVVEECSTEGEETALAAVQNLGDQFENLFRRLEEAVGWFSTSPARCQARFWEILWNLTAEQEQPQVDPLVSHALQLIELRLSQRVSVADLARELGVSHNHLTRRFRSQTGKTVVEFIRAQRTDRAQHLLRHSTLPIKAIATQVGLGDFHSFNKAMRRADGCGPREARARSRANKTP